MKGGDFVDFVTDVFMTPEGCSHPEVDEELIRLEDSGALQRAREDSRADIDALIDRILNCAPESRPAMLGKIDSKILALVYDRVQCGTHVMIEMANKGVVLPQKGAPPMPLLFRQLLLQRFP